MQTWALTAALEHGYSAGMPTLVAAVQRPGLPDLSPAEVAAELNAERRTVLRKVPTWEARAFLLKTGEWGGIKLLSRRVPPDDDPVAQMLVAAAITAVDTMTETGELDTDEPDTFAVISSMCDAFVMAGAMSEASKVTLLGLRDELVPRWLPAVTDVDVVNARTLIAG